VTHKNPTASPESAALWPVDTALMELLLRLRRDNLPQLVQLCTVMPPGGFAPSLRIRVASYIDACVWSAAFGGPVEPDQHIVHTEGIVFYRAEIPCAIGGWTVEIEARVTAPRGLAVNEDMVDGLELVAASVQGAGVLAGTR